MHFGNFIILVIILSFLITILFCVLEMKDEDDQNKDKVWYARKRIWCGIPCTFTIYSFDDERFYIDSGFLNKKSEEVRLYRILDISLSRSLLQRLFGMGSISINSSDKTLGNFTINNIKDSRKVKEQLSTLVESCRDKKHVVSREFMDTDDEAIE